MFGEQITQHPRIASPWSARLSSSVSTSASTTAPATPPPLHASAQASHKPMDAVELPSLHLLDLSDEADSGGMDSDESEEADGFFSLDMDVSIDQQISDVPYEQRGSVTIAQPDHHEPLAPHISHSLSSASAPIHHPISASPAARRASETVYSSSPLHGVGRDPIAATRARDASASAAGSPSFGPIAPEVDQKGNLEYKLKILPPSRERFDRLVTQLKWRLLEGGGLAVYEIGVLDDGTLIGLDPDSMKDSIKLLSLMAAEVGARCEVQRVLSLQKSGVGETGASLAATASAAAAAATTGAKPFPVPHMASSQADLSLRALDDAEARHILLPFVETVDIEEQLRDEILQTGAAGRYRFNMVPPEEIAQEITSAVESDACNPISHSRSPSPQPLPPRSTEQVRTNSAGSLATPSTSIGQDEDQISAPTRRRLDKASGKYAGGRTKRDILEGLDHSAVVYLPSKEEKRIQRAETAQTRTQLVAADMSPQLKAESASASPVAAPSDTAAVNGGRTVMDKMTRVADSVQPKTARAKARARKSHPCNQDDNGDGTSMAPSASQDSETASEEGAAIYSVSPTSPCESTSPSPASRPAQTITFTGPYSGYENVMADFGVLSERAARSLYGGCASDGRETETDSPVSCGRLIVEAVVRRDVNSTDNFIDFQGAKKRLQLSD